MELAEHKEKKIAPTIFLGNLLKRLRAQP